jgi:hypothetical protein
MYYYLYFLLMTSFKLLHDRKMLSIDIISSKEFTSGLAIFSCLGGDHPI